MKILVVNHVNGNIDLINKYAKEAKASLVLFVGTFGIHDETKKLDSNFYEYMNGTKNFEVMTAGVRGAHDHLSLCEKLYNKNITINNFLLMSNGTSYNIPVNGTVFNVGGIGGTYSCKHFGEERLYGAKRRHFTQKEFSKFYSKPVQILLLGDVPGDYKDEKLIFKRPTYDIIEGARPFYCFVGKYNFWASTKMKHFHLGIDSETNMVFLPYVKSGYFVIDTEKEWDSEGIQLDFKKEPK